MHPILTVIADALDLTSNQIVNAYGSDAILSTAFGWNHPAVTKYDLGGISSTLAKKIREANLDEVTHDQLTLISAIPQKLQSLQNTTIQFMFNGNGSVAIPMYINTIDIFDKQLDFIWDFEQQKDNLSIKPLLSKIRSTQNILSSIIGNKDDLEKQVSQIREAADIADTLPIDLQNLSDARTKMHQSSLDVALIEAELGDKKETIIRETEEISIQAKKARVLISQCEEAYRATTTKGLAGAFNQKAISLTRSTWIWVFALIISLGIIAKIGFVRITSMSTIPTDGSAKFSIIALELVLSVLSLSAPIWFAWLSTKQIGQRFRLAEDYWFKATVAKAYEGYRKEAARLDPALEQRLFSSALNRFDEAPLRFLSTEDFSSPWQEFFASKELQDAFAKIPELHDKYLDVAKSAFAGVKGFIKR